MNESDAKKIDVFQNRCLRRVMRIKWQDKISNRELLERANVETLSEEVRRRRWRFIGHILRQQLFICQPLVLLHICILDLCIINCKCGYRKRARRLPL